MYGAIIADVAPLVYSVGDDMNAEVEIRRRIAARGAIPFAEFMELALYHPVGGYYTAGDRVGAGGDFFTSPAAHPAFGALLAAQLFQMWQLLGRPAPFTVAEAGAGDGLLGRDILSAAAVLPGDFGRCLRYVGIDRRPGGGYDTGLPGAHRIAASGLPLRGMTGCILSNELLDAMPAHQVTLEAGRLREIYVAADGDGLVTQTGEPSTPLLACRLAGLGVALAEGQVAEVNLALDGWTAAAAQSLRRGFVLTIDYGRPARELYAAAQRFRGTLTTFYRHTQTDRPLERIGRQDLSAQVDFTSLARAGAQAGLDFLGYDRQSAFLYNLGLRQWLERRSATAPRPATAERAGMRELAKPGGLGDFKVMAQGKNAGRPRLWGFHPAADAAALAAQTPPPTLTPQHLNLPAGRYPAAEMEFEAAWDALWPPDPA